MWQDVLDTHSVKETAWFLFNFNQIHQKDKSVLLKDLSDLYNTQVSLSGSLVCRQRLMEEVLANEVGDFTTMENYFNPANESSVAAW